MSHIPRNRRPSRYLEVDNVADLVAAVAAAVAGDHVHMLPGTYTLTAATGPLEPSSGVELTGSGVDQTTITEDGTLAGPLISFPEVVVGTYGVGAIALWASAGVTDVAAEAGNISDGDVLYLVDGGGSEFLTSVADGDGVPGSGAFDFQDRTPTPLNAASTMQVSTPTTHVKMSGFTLLGDGANTTYGIEGYSLVDCEFTDIVIDDTITSGHNLWRMVRCTIDLLTIRAPQCGNTTRSTACKIRVRSVSLSGTANNHQNTGNHYCYIKSFHTNSNTTDWEVSLYHSQRTFIWSSSSDDTAGGGNFHMVLSNADECVVRWDARWPVQSTGTVGNSIVGT